MNAVFRIFNYLFRVVLLLPVFYLANYEQSLNPDIINYMNDYVNSNWTYDIGYEAFANLIKSFLNLPFEHFWTLQLIIQICLLALIFKNYILLLISYPNLVFLSETLFGTQIRFAIGIEIFTLGFLAFKNRKVLSYYLVSITFHYGILLIVGTYLYKEYFFKYRTRTGMRIALQLMVFSIGALVFSFSIDWIANATRYSYYVGSRYFEAKSLSSILYVLLFFVIVGYYFFIRKVNSKVIEFSFYILLLILMTSSFAVVSGRMQIFFFLLEPILIYSIFHLKRKDDYIIGSFLLVVSLTKFIGFYI
tara:strand:- start:30 stop:944 length:915 start_codon:yes stop_codon:yes gene_type:complete